MWIPLIPVINHDRQQNQERFDYLLGRLKITEDIAQNALLEIAELQKQLGDAQNAA
ncbi:MAG: hypothetical protein ACE3JK_02635 [Sporolactobacillus sp.]